MKHRKTTPGSRQRTATGLVMLRNCLTAGVALLLAALAAASPGRAQEAGYSGDRAGLTQLLRHFLHAEADVRALTLVLRPTREDYLAAYRQPLADRLVETYEAMWEDEDTAIMPKQGQTDILIGVTSSDRLIAHHPDLDEFPGGYKQVLAFLQPGIAIARCRFVVPGETRGMAYDGFVFVNGRWVFIPKPWRALP